MPKNIPAPLLSDIRAKLATMTFCVKIKRRSGRILRVTAHERDLTIDGEVYRSDIPFTLSTIRSGSQMSVDNADVTLFPDGVTILQEDFDNRLYDYADVEIFEVDYTAVSDGVMVLRKGQFGAYDYARNGAVKMTVTGLMKILDFTVGRVYQPSCDADLGDKRCKVAIRHGQAYSPYNPYFLGDWVFRYDPDLMTAITVVNPSFEVDGFRSNVQAITGWTRTPGAQLIVTGDGGTIGTFTPLDGDYMLRGDADTAEDGHENTVYQDIDLVAAGGLDTADIDDGKITLAFVAGMLQGFYLLDPARFKIDVMNADGEIIETHDTTFTFLDKIDSWRERWLAFPLLAGARSVRIWLTMLKGDGTQQNTAIDHVRLWWWDHTEGNPYGDVVHRLTRIASRNAGNVFNISNASFETANVANGLSPTIAGWTTTGSWWRVAGTVGGLSANDGDRFLHGGDDGGATQQTYNITQTFSFTGANRPNIDAVRVTQGKVGGRMKLNVGFDDLASAGSVVLDFLDDSNAVVGTFTALNEMIAASTGWYDVQADYAIPSTARKIKITLTAKSPVGSGNARVGFDRVEFWFFDAERASKEDPISGTGTTDTVWSTDIGSFTFDSSLVWRAVGAFTLYDEVSAVTSKKLFQGTDIAGADGSYEGAAIKWLSGDNAGFENNIRTWDPDTKSLKLYFNSPYPIQVGDRFMYTRNCQRRFLEDCQSVFGNQINFRGFPHLPGKLTNEG